MSGFVEFVTAPEFLTGVSVPLLLGGLAYFSTRNSDTRKMKHEDLKSDRQILRETANEFSAVCSSVFEKAIDSEKVFNTVMDFVQNMNEIPDTKVMDKLEYAVDLMEETKRITTAYNHLRVVAPVAVLEKASALNAAVLALCKATTVPLAKPPLMQQAGKAMEDFTNAVRAELGLEAFTAEDANRVGRTYMEVLTKQMNDYIKETQEEARRFGFLEPGSMPITPIRASDLTAEHIGKFVGCNDVQSGFNYGAKIINVARQDYGPRPGILLRLSHPSMPGGRPAREDRTVLTPDQVVQLVEMPT